MRAQLTPTDPHEPHPRVRAKFAVPFIATATFARRLLDHLLTILLIWRHRAGRNFDWKCSYLASPLGQ